LPAFIKLSIRLILAAATRFPPIRKRAVYRPPPIFFAAFSAIAPARRRFRVGHEQKSR
jgi:hypothetical protein